MAGWPTVADLAVHLDFVDADQVQEQSAALALQLDAAREHVGLYTSADANADLPIPSGLYVATLLIAAQLWEAQRGNAGQSYMDGGPPRGFAVPNRAWELMRPHMIVGVV